MRIKIVRPPERNSRRNSLDYDVIKTLTIDLEKFYTYLCETGNYTNTEAKDIQDCFENFIRINLI
jgi:hypothetical protein